MDASERQAAKKRSFRLRMIGASIGALIMLMMSIRTVIELEGLTLRGVAALAIILAAVGVGGAIAIASLVRVGALVDAARGLNHSSGSDEDPE